MDTEAHWQIIWYLIDDSDNWQWLKNWGVRLMANNNVDNIYHLSRALYQALIDSWSATRLLSLNAALLVEHITRDLQVSEKISRRKKTVMVTFFEQLECKLLRPWTQA